MFRAFVSALLIALAWPSLAAADNAPARKGSRMLDLRAGPEVLGSQTPELPRSATSLAPAGAAASPPETVSRPGLAIELQPLRRREQASEGDGAASEPRERDALADRLERLGIEEFVIRFVRPL